MTPESDLLFQFYYISYDTRIFIPTCEDALTRYIYPILIQSRVGYNATKNTSLSVRSTKSCALEKHMQILINTYIRSRNAGPTGRLRCLCLSKRWRRVFKSRQGNGCLVTACHAT
jgi:hypothetical protein